MRAHSLVVAIHLTSLVAGALIAPDAAAQYRWVGPDGAVTYSDRPPPSGARDVATVPGAAASTPAAASLPSGLRATASRFPVTLYTTDPCSPCQQARSHLMSRGIPFNERSVRTYADFEAYKKLGLAGEGFPAVTVGREHSVGFEAGALDRLLDVAGYPQTSMLPRGYRQTPTQSLTEPVPAPLAAGTGDAARTADPASADAPRPAPTPVVSSGSGRNSAASGAGPALRF